MKELQQLFKKIGFWKIFDILKDWTSSGDNDPQEWVNCLPLDSFLIRLEKIGNRNLYHRNKEILFQEQLIKVFKLNDKEMIQLTQKGIELYEILVYLKKKIFKKQLEGFNEW